MIFNMNCFKTLLFLMLLVFNPSVSATEASIDDPYAAFPLYKELLEQNYSKPKLG